MSVKNAKILCYDRGDHTYLAEKLAEEAAKVYLYTPILGPHPITRDDQIGAGLDGVEKIDDFEAYKDEVDMIFFPSVYDGEKCADLREKGYRCFGAGAAEEIELDRVRFIKTLKEVGLDVIPTYRAVGLDDAIKHLKDKKDKWIKTPYCRGDFDTINFVNMDVHEPWFNLYRSKLGKRGSETIELLIQDSFPAEVEAGGDRYCIDGVFTKKGMVGYEIKDKGYIFKVVDEFPSVINQIDMKMSPVFQKLGYRGAWSSECRISKKNGVRFTDATCRFGSPPGEAWCEIYNHFAQDVFDVSNGEIPNLEEKNKYGAIIILVSWFNEDNEICVEFPEEYSKNIKLKNHYKHNGKYYCVPNESDGYFGAAIAIGDSIKAVNKKALEVASEVRTLGFEFDSSVFDKAMEKVKEGEKFGILM
jgi:hypothetical protein